MKLANNDLLAGLVAFGLLALVVSGDAATSGNPKRSRDAAEVLTYPPLLQTNLSTRFVQATEKLSQAKTDVARYLALPEAAKLAFVFGNTEDARKYATELLALDEKFRAEFWRNGDAAFSGNFVLGRIAVQKGEVSNAKHYLLASGQSIGSPTLGSFGPNMSLAKDLIRTGQRETVLQYFELCRKFWKGDNGKLTQWAEDLKTGKQPDFGANLYY